MGSRKAKKKRDPEPEGGSAAEPAARQLPPAHPPRKHPGFLLAMAVLFGLWVAFLVAMAVWG